MNLTQQQINEVLSMDIQTAYEFYLVCRIENPELNKYYEQIRYGIDFDLDIHDLIDEQYIMKPKAQKVKINKQAIPLKMFRTEVENRISIIKKAILDHVTEETVFEER